MFRTLIALLAGLLVTGVLKAQEPPTPEQVNLNPQKYVGQTIVFDHMQLLGTAVATPFCLQFTVKSSEGTVFEREQTAIRGVTFLAHGKPKSLTAFFRPLKADQYYPVRLTCKMERKNRRGVFLARVHQIDLIRFDCTENAAGVAVPVVTSEQINKEPAKYAGKTVVLDGLSLTGTTRDMRIRTALAVRTPADTFFGTGVSRTQTFLISIRNKDALAKKYLDSGLKDDLTRPLRMTVEVATFGESNYRADVKRLDVIAYRHDQKAAKTDEKAPEKVEKKPQPKLTGKWNGTYTAGLVKGEATSMALQETDDGEFAGVWTDRHGSCDIKGVRTGNKIAYFLTWRHPVVGPMTENVLGEISSNGKTLTMQFTASWKEGKQSKVDKSSAILQRE